MINWNDLSTQIAAAVIAATILAVAGLLWKNYGRVGRWLSTRPWAVSALIAISAAVIVGGMVFVVVETQLAQLKEDLIKISSEANGPAAKLSQVSDLAKLNDRLAKFENRVGTLEARDRTPDPLAEYCVKSAQQLQTLAGSGVGFAMREAQGLQTAMASAGCSSPRK